MALDALLLHYGPKREGLGMTRMRRLAVMLTALVGIGLGACSVEKAAEGLLSLETVELADRAQAALIARDAEMLRELMGETVSG